ncbi:MAG: hypothetical protein IPJ94_24180 [Chloroflexi bacterium]|nr:hypothetical protein [Chloroflexota bacterium]
MAATKAATSQKVSRGSVKAVALNWMAKGGEGEEEGGENGRYLIPIQPPRPHPHQRNQQNRGDEIGQPGGDFCGAKHRVEVKQGLQIKQQRGLVDGLRQQQRVAPGGDEARPGGKQGLVGVEGVGEEGMEAENGRDAHRTPQTHFNTPVHRSGNFSEVAELPRSC